MSVWRPALIVLGLLSFAGCTGFGPLVIKVKPYNLALTIPPAGSVTHVASFSSYGKLVEECGMGRENARKMYERSVAGITDRDRKGEVYREMISSVLEEAMAECLERQPNLVPRECKRRMVARGGFTGRGGGAVAFQCGYSATLPLEVVIRPLDPTGKTKRSPAWGTHLATYSDLDKLLDECGPGAEKARDIAVQSDDDLWDAFGRIVDNALVKCLEERNLIPAECRYEMVPVHNVPVRSFEPKIRFRCKGAATDALLH